MDNESIKTNILRFRHMAGLTIEQAAAAMELSVASYKKIEKGATRIVYRYLDRLAAALNVTPEQIVLGYQPLDPGSAEYLGEDNRQRYYHGVMEDYESRLREKERVIADKERTIQDLREYIDMQKLLHEAK